mmetsp:Transcript_9010/g.28066  ORF Transcript_9010/g.28066 Transcript_9010/m.28066 type:complete len:228 (-) Transcript_9010:2295-2978(-)
MARGLRSACRLALGELVPPAAEGEGLCLHARQVPATLSVPQLLPEGSGGNAQGACACCWQCLQPRGRRGLPHVEPEDVLAPRRPQLLVRALAECGKAVEEGHLAWCQLEVKEHRVLQDTLPRGRLGDDRYPVLQGPAVQHLRSCSAACTGYSQHMGVLPGRQELRPGVGDGVAHDRERVAAGPLQGAGAARAEDLLARLVDLEDVLQVDGLHARKAPELLQLLSAEV